MSDASALVVARQQLAHGVGQTTRENRVLPFAALAVPIPERVGFALLLQSGSNFAPFKRGFVAVAHGATTGKLFDPYTMTVIEPAYRLVHAPYASAGLATAHNVPDADTTLWFDTLAFFDLENALYVNAEKYPALLIDPLDLAFKAIPYFIKSTTLPSLPYGSPGENAEIKRVFAVGRYAVKSWAFGGTTVTLTPTTPRADNKAMTIGQRISGTDKAMLSQFYFTGASWDSLAGGWGLSFAEVTMLLASPYLTSVSGSSTVDQAVCTPVASGSSSPSSSVAATLPSVELCAVGVGELAGASFSPEGLYEMAQYLRFPARETFAYSPPGAKETSGTANSWSGSQSASPVVAGRTLTYAASSSLVKTSQSENYTYPAFSAPLFTATGAGTSPGMGGNYYSGSGGYGVWGTTAANTTPRDANGKGDYDHSAGALPTPATYITATQSGSASVKLGAIELVNVTFSRNKTSGNQVVPSPITGRYDSVINDTPYAWTVPGSSVDEPSSRFFVSMYAAEPNHPDVVGKRQPMILAKAAEFVGGKFYDNVNAHNSSALYNSTITARPTVDDQALNWNTTDYILYDETNGVYVSIISSFVGTQAYGASGTGTLTVSWKVESPSGTVTHQIHEETIGYSELLPESVLVFGVNYVQSPKIRAVFAPLYQEQGSFKGAHCVTQAEVANGAAPFHGFNFFLRLRPYGDLSAINADNDSGPNVNFVPVNLLEMLYAYVFSSKYGVDPYARYPVDRTATFTSLTDALFTPAFRVAVKNGAQDNWTDALGVAAADLYRT